ncbi:heparin lyase I family protein [Paraglaciecola sp.]|uniref:heparin lyase I family protein n=1 Tax=Paraglaciecola sp. TaxID=1920173 RepID=UPI003267BE39
MITIKFIKALSLSVLLIQQVNAAVDISPIISYLNSDKSNKKTFLWTGATEGVVSAATQNWNTLSAVDWGVTNRSTDLAEPVKLYADTDPGFSGPNGESYGIEIEVGYVPPEPRSAGSAVVRYYTDFGQSGIVNSGIDRAEIFIQSTLDTMELSEGDTIWVGWSEYYTHLDHHRDTSLFQFRNQSDVYTLADKGFSEEEVLDFFESGLTDGGPAAAVLHKSIDNAAHYRFSVRHGTPANWTFTAHTLEEPVATGRWYDIIIKLKYSQESDGEYKVWFYDTTKNHSNYSIDDELEWDYAGNTMYDYPDTYSPTMEFRTGLYRYEAKEALDIDESNRYMTKYMGPTRLWLGSDDEGFDYVKPRD